MREAVIFNDGGTEIEEPWSVSWILELDPDAGVPRQCLDRVAAWGGE